MSLQLEKITAAAVHRPILDHPVDEPVGERLGGAEVAIAILIGVNALGGPIGVPGVDLVDARPQGEDLPGENFDVGLPPGG